MAAVLAVLWATLAGSLFTLLVMGLFALTDPQHWRVVRRRTTKALRRYARQTHIRGQRVRSEIAWVLADLTERRRA